MENIVIFVVLMSLGYFFGTMLEKRHYESIRKRERALRLLPTILLKRPLEPEKVRSVKLVSGSVVVSIDYFKRVIAMLITLFGGRITTYETLVDRARREAILRMKEKAKGAAEIINVRIETSSISKNDNNNVGSVEVLAYGTAVYR